MRSAITYVCLHILNLFFIQVHTLRMACSAIKPWIAFKTSRCQLRLNQHISAGYLKDAPIGLLQWQKESHRVTVKQQRARNVKEKCVNEYKLLCMYTLRVNQR